jgi:hypothetical protein
MAELSLPKTVQRITGLEKDHMGQLRPYRISKKRSKKKRKVSWALRGQERELRRLAQAERDFADDYLRRHEKSAKKRRNGYLTDLPINLERSYHKALKTFYK